MTFDEVRAICLALPAVEEGRTTPLGASQELLAEAASMLARDRSTNREGS